jgi:ATP-dependent exoDNAse (exonuclease V) alpha subunit
MSAFVKLPEYDEAIQSILKNQVTYLSGSAGTGKSTFIKYIKSKVSKHLLLAPTGIAALNIGGKTIHSTFKFPAKFIFESDIKKLNVEYQAFISQISLIIIDEVSMVSANLIDAVDIFLRKNLGKDVPFGGIKILLVGDLFQLPPVVQNNVEHIYRDYYKTNFFFSSNIIKDLIKKNLFKMVELKSVMRQKGDDLFISILQNIRVGSNISDSIDILNEYATINKELLDGYLHITPYKDVCNYLNSSKLDSINSQGKSYFSYINGDIIPSNFPVDEVIQLKIGAQVMIIKNMPDQNIINGSIGKVTFLGQDNVIVDVNGTNIVLKYNKWSEYRYKKVNGVFTSTLSGEFQQIPLRLAWSMTIHKVQSASIDKLHIDMDRGAFESGMLYVALSRARSINGLSLSKPLKYDDVIVNQDVLNFYFYMKETQNG